MMVLKYLKIDLCNMNISYVDERVQKNRKPLIWHSYTTLLRYEYMLYQITGNQDHNSYMIYGS